MFAIRGTSLVDGDREDAPASTAQSSITYSRGKRFMNVYLEIAMGHAERLAELPATALQSTIQADLVERAEKDGGHFRA